MVVVLNTFYENQIQSCQELLYASESISVWYDPENDWIYTEWNGYLNLHVIRENGENILHFLKEKQCSKILSNNQRVKGAWLDSCNYLAEDLLPKLKESGLKFLAWVQSPSPYSQYSTEQTMEATCITIKSQINFFHSVPVAKDWLKSVH